MFPSLRAWEKGTATLKLQDPERRRFFGRVSAFFSPCLLLPVVRKRDPMGPHACQVALCAQSSPLGKHPAFLGTG